MIKNKKLVQAFSNYQKRSGKRVQKKDWENILPEILYRTMRLEGEKITRKEAKSLFR
jgi:hypothetical protein